MNVRIVTPPGTHLPVVPRWLVTNGDVTVGPVPTDLLMRGVQQRRVPLDCWVREEGWRSWRALWQLREVAPLYHQVWQGLPASDLPLGALPVGPLLDAARDPEEVLHLGLHAALHRTGAALGLLHRFDAEALLPPRTTVVHGPGTRGLLGVPLPRRDLVIGAARARCLVVGPPEQSNVHRATALRLSAGARTLAGVAIVPVLRGEALVAVMELGRVDHPFRVGDGATLQELAQGLGRRLRDRHN